jgi:molybdopterin-dependent oxidoreductase alpha subunit
MLCGRKVRSGRPIVGEIGFSLGLNKEIKMSQVVFAPRKVRIVPPAELTGLKMTPVKDRAAGIPAVTVAMKHIAEEVGLWKGLKALSKLNQREGFDCPGCAWPEPAHRSAVAEYCENGAKAIAEEATHERCDEAFFAAHSVEEMSDWSDYRIGKSGRITHPMYLPRGESRYQPISWEEAFALIAEELRSCESPHEAVFYTSGRTSNEAAFLYQLLVRQWGTNNLPDCSNMCHESSGVALSETIGIGKGTVTLDDIHQAEVILVVGQNPGTNHPRMLSALTECKKNGGTIIHINPLPEAGTTRFINPQNPVEVMLGGTQLADHYLQVKIGGDLALFRLINRELIRMETRQPGSVADRSFIEQHTDQWDAFLQAADQLDEQRALADCGISMDRIPEIARILASHSKIITCWAMGLTQQKHAVGNIREIVNMHLLRGAIGKPGAGVCPVRGHSNVQGDRTMGIYEKPKESFLERIDQHFGIRCPREHGYDTVEAIEAMHKGKVRVFMAMGGNFISATPDSEFTGRAMQKCSLTVQISTKLNRAHLVTGEHALILPCLGRTEVDVQASGEQFVTVENSMGVVHRSRGVLKPCSPHLLSEPAIVCRLGKAVFGDASPIKWDEMCASYDTIRDHIEGSIDGFAQYNSRVRQPDGFYLPNGPRERRFTTENGRARFTINPLPDLTVPAGHFIMMTVRSHDQYNTTIYGLNDRYRGIANERRVILMNPADMKRSGWHERQLVNIISIFEGTERRADRFHVIPFDIATGCVATYFPETNCLVPINSTADKSNTPVSKFIVVRLERMSE